MHYQARHRRQATSDGRGLRRTGMVAALAATALIAPLAVSGPVASQAAVTPTPYDTLLNHPEWRRSPADPHIATLVADLKSTYAEHGIASDPAMIAAYRAPTVEGFVTYVTTHPETFTVRPNPGLIKHMPDGDTAVAATEALYRLLEPPTGLPSSGVGIPADFLYALLFDHVWGADDLPAAGLHALAQYGGDHLMRLGQDAGPLVAQVFALIDAAKDDPVHVGTEIAVNPQRLVDQALLTAGAWRAEAERQAAAVVGSTGPLVEQVTLTLNAWRAEAEHQVNVVVEQALTALNELDPERDAATVVDVVPMAAGSLPVNTGTAATSPLAQPVTEPLDAGLGVVPAPQVADAYQAYELRTRDEETKPAWNRNNEDCFLSDNNAWWRRGCWTIDNQINDDTADKTYWQFQLKASSYPKQKRGMFHVWVEGVPMQDYSAQRFDGTLPIPDQAVGGESGCASGTQSLSLSGGKPVQVGYSYSYSITTCETYTPKGYSDEGHWSNKWHFNPDRNSNGVGYGSSDTDMRSVGFNMGIKTSSSAAKVGWTMPSGTEVSKKYCC